MKVVRVLFHQVRNKHCQKLFPCPVFSCVCNDWCCLSLLALNSLVIINPLGFTSLSNYWLAVVLVLLIIFSMTVFSSKIRVFWVSVVSKCKCFELTWESQDLFRNNCFPIQNLGSVCGILLDAVPWEVCIISCCKQTSSVCSTPAEVFWVLGYSGFCCIPPAGQRWMRLSLGLRLRGITSKSVLTEVLWVSFSWGFVSFLSFFRVSNSWMWILCLEMWVSSLILFM